MKICTEAVNLLEKGYKIINIESQCGETELSFKYDESSNVIIGALNKNLSIKRHIPTKEFLSMYYAHKDLLHKLYETNKRIRELAESIDFHDGKSANEVTEEFNKITNDLFKTIAKNKEVFVLMADYEMGNISNKQPTGTIFLTKEEADKYKEPDGSMVRRDYIEATIKIAE